MTNLLIIADDLTGALDTGIQFAKRGISTEISLSLARGVHACSAQVLVIDAETRHLPPDRAYELVRAIAREALDAGVDYLYKKTDSALRGCVGAELAAVAEAGEGALAFIPALPKLGRTTKDGIQYINGVEVAKSAFGSDPCEPVRHSYIPDIIAEQSGIPCECRYAAALQYDSPHIHIYDAESDEEIHSLASGLLGGSARLFAGCAGLAGALADILPFHRGTPGSPVQTAAFSVVCGSLNPAALEQVGYAIRHGFDAMAVRPSAMLEDGFLAAPRGGLREAIVRRLDQGVSFLLHGEPGEYLAAGEAARARIADGFGGMAALWLPYAHSQTLLLTGGDTLRAFIRHCGNPAICPICELRDGVVCSRIAADGRELQIVSKAGGFGGPELFIEIKRMLTR